MGDLPFYVSLAFRPEFAPEVVGIGFSATGV